MARTYEVRWQLGVEDAAALWDAASVKALSYPDVTSDSLIEMLGPREDPEIADCLLLLTQPSLPGCTLLTLGCTVDSESSGEPADGPPVERTAIRTASPSGIATGRAPSLVRAWKARGTDGFSRSSHIVD